MLFKPKERMIFYAIFSAINICLFNLRPAPLEQKLLFNYSLVALVLILFWVEYVQTRTKK